jgi:hypothetical protein
MRVPEIAAAGLGAAVVVGIALGGCSSGTSTGPSSSGPSTTSSSSSAAASPGPAGDYSALLINAGDITQPADFFTDAPPTGFTAAAPTQNPTGKQGVATVFTSQDGSRQITDTILILADAAAAKTALDAAVSGLGSAVAFPTPQPSQVGTNGTLVSGTSPDGSKGVTFLLFTEGRAFTTLEFDGAPNDPVAADFPDDVGQKQDTAIKAGLPG